MNDAAGNVVSYELVDGVAVVTIERPDVKNALSVEVFEGLSSMAERAATDDGAGAVLVRGRGGSLSSGLDLSLFTSPPEGGLDAGFIAQLQASFTSYEDLDKPTVALIEGYCYGGGIQLAAACHVRLVAPGARIRILERRWGLIPDLGGTYRLPRLVGLGRATELILTAREIDAATAVQIGLADVALEGDDPFGHALSYAHDLATGPGAVRRAPRLIRENWARSRDEALAAERTVQLENLAGDDVLEAVTAHLEGRDPAFKGR